LLSRLHRRAEALDEACLRAWGHPHDHAIQQELLNALELDGSLHPEHARPIIRDLFKQVHDHSIDLSNRIPIWRGQPRRRGPSDFPRYPEPAPKPGGAGASFGGASQ
jgi:hypothetical protein